MQGLSRFQSLEQLSLAGCGIRDDVLASFPVLPALTGLILSDNLATNLHALAACTNLRDLDLSGNRISDIKALDPLKPLNLTSLDLGGCPLDVAPADVFDMLATLTYFNGEDRLGKGERCCCSTPAAATCMALRRPPGTSRPVRSPLFVPPTERPADDEGESSEGEYEEEEYQEGEEEEEEQEEGDPAEGGEGGDLGGEAGDDGDDDVSACCA